MNVLKFTLFFLIILGPDRGFSQKTISLLENFTSIGEKYSDANQLIDEIMVSDSSAGKFLVLNYILPSNDFHLEDSKLLLSRMKFYNSFFEGQGDFPFTVVNGVSRFSSEDKDSFESLSDGKSSVITFETLPSTLENGTIKISLNKIGKNNDAIFVFVSDIKPMEGEPIVKNTVIQIITLPEREELEIAEPKMVLGTKPKLYLIDQNPNSGQIERIFNIKL